MKIEKKGGSQERINIRSVSTRKSARHNSFWRATLRAVRGIHSCPPRLAIRQFRPPLLPRPVTIQPRPKRGKDAYDILSLVQSNIDAPEAAVASFGQEKQSDNQGLELALRTLEEHFTDGDRLGPTLAASFYLGSSENEETSLRLREDLVTVGYALLEA